MVEASSRAHLLARRLATMAAAVWTSPLPAHSARQRATSARPAGPPTHGRQAPPMPHAAGAAHRKGAPALLLSLLPSALH